jgi:SAM-dependent methyltransferase
MSKEKIIKYIEGIDNVEQYFSSINDVLLSGDEVLTFGARAGNPYSVEIVNFFLKTVENRSKKGIKTKIMFNDDARDIGKTFESLNLVNVRYMPMGIAPKAGFDIYGDTTGIMDWSNPSNPRVILIEDKQISDSYREYFEILWSATIAITELEKKGNFYLPEILFENFVNHSDEKEKVESKILDILNAEKPKKILNIGSGFDNLSNSREFPDSVEKITLVEKNTSYVQSYTETKAEVIHADFEFWQTDEKYDVILASHVLYYFKDKKLAIEKVLSHLNDGGIALFVINEPSKDYRKLKDFVFGFYDKQYIFTYDKLIKAVNDLGCKFDEVKIDCNITAKSNEELYKALRLWFEMDLNSYYEHEKEIGTLFPENKVKYTNIVFILHK